MNEKPQAPAPAHATGRWTVISPDGKVFTGESAHRAANEANKHLRATDPAEAQKWADMLDRLRAENEAENERLLAEHGTLNCPACGGSGHIGDVSEFPAPAHSPTGQQIVEALREAMEKAGVPHNFRADLIGHFCNGWNQLLQAPAVGAVENWYELRPRVPMLELGRTYKTISGKKVRMVSISNAGTEYESMADEEGHHRYSRSHGRIIGRCTGSKTDDPLNIAFDPPPAFHVPVQGSAE